MRSGNMLTVEHLVRNVQRYDRIPYKSSSDYTRKKLMSVRQWFGGKCFHCGVNDELEFAHVLPTRLSGSGRGRADRLYDILRFPASYILLCKQCHKEFDDDDIPGIPNLFGIKLKGFIGE